MPRDACRGAPEGEKNLNRDPCLLVKDGTMVGDDRVLVQVRMGVAAGRRSGRGPAAGLGSGLVGISATGESGAVALVRCGENQNLHAAVLGLSFRGGVRCDRTLIAITDDANAMRVDLMADQFLPHAYGAVR